MALEQPTPQKPPELWRWDGEEKGWTRIDEPALSWSNWTSWIIVEAASPTNRPLQQPIPKGPGVYEIRRTDATHSDERLYIGSSRKGEKGLSKRLHDDLIHDTKGQNHVTPKLLEAVDGKKELLEIRWAPCQSQEDAHFYEQYLCSRYLLRFGKLPDFVKTIG